MGVVVVHHECRALRPGIVRFGYSVESGIGNVALHFHLVAFRREFIRQQAREETFRHVRVAYCRPSFRVRVRHPESHVVGLFVGKVALVVDGSEEYEIFRACGIADVHFYTRIDGHHLPFVLQSAD